MQVVGYEASPDAAVIVAADGAVEREPLIAESTLSYSLGDRHCAGVVDAPDHHPCQVDDAPYCDRHTQRWACARCTGDCQLPLPACREEHAVYLAAFAPDVWKVGVTRSWRLETRLQEQGADRGAHIRTVDTGRRARRIEAGIAEEIGDRVRVPTKIAGLHQAVDRSSWEELLDDYDPIETYAFEYGFDLEQKPIPTTTATGTVLGVQGRVLVLDRGGTTYAVDLRDLVGHDLSPGASDRDRQSSLGKFG
ncbi:MAG: DUF2797 domain-containing protein [Halobacteriaceae archaeon]